MAGQRDCNCSGLIRRGKGSRLVGVTRLQVDKATSRDPLSTRTPCPFPNRCRRGGVRASNRYNVATGGPKNLVGLFLTSKGCEGFIRHRPPDPTLESASPSPPQGSIWHRFNINSTLIRHRNRVKSGNRCRINVKSMPNRPLRREGEADSRVGSGALVPNKPLTFQRLFQFFELFEITSENALYPSFLCMRSSFFCPVHPTLPQAIFFPRIPSLWDFGSTLSSREKVICRGWVLGMVLDGVPPQEKKENPFFFFLARKKKDAQRTPKGGGGNRGGGGGQNLTRRTPTENSFDPPSPRYVPPPHVISLIKSLTNTQNFPQVTPSKTVVGGSPNMVSDGPFLRGFAPARCFAPHPPSSTFGHFGCFDTCTRPAGLQG